MGVCRKDSGSGNPDLWLCQKSPKNAQKAGFQKVAMDKLTAPLLRAGATGDSAEVRYASGCAAPGVFFASVENSIVVTAAGWRVRAACAVSWEV